MSAESYSEVHVVRFTHQLVPFKAQLSSLPFKVVRKYICPYSDISEYANLESLLVEKTSFL